MPTRDELKKLARTRLREAKVLHARGLHDGSYYLAGYVVELALKARICKLLDLARYPETGSFKTHRLDDLLWMAGLQRRLEKTKVQSPGLFASWSVVTEWSPELRYSPVGTNPRVSAEKFITALDDAQNGVFTWLKKHW